MVYSLYDFGVPHNHYTTHNHNTVILISYYNNKNKYKFFLLKIKNILILINCGFTQNQFLKVMIY